MPITWLSLVIYVQFGLGAVLVLYTLLGISIGHEIGRLLLLAVLQIVIAVPGSVYTFRKEGPLLLVYVAAQAWTGASELIWIVIHLVGGGDVATAFLLGILAFIQFFSVGTVFCCRERIVLRHRKDDLDTHLRVSATKNPATAELTMSAEVAQQPRLEKTSPKKSQTSQRQAPGETTTTEQNKPTQDIRPADEGNGDKVPERVKEIRKLIDAMNARVEKRSQESLRNAASSRATQRSA